MSFVRESRFRHVYGEEFNSEQSYTDVPALTVGESSFVKVNPKFWAVAKKGGGGPLIVHNVGDYGRLDLKHPTINVQKAQILDFDFNPFKDNVIATASDDCTIAVTKFPEEGLKENISEADAMLMGHQKKLTYVQWHPTANNVIASCGYDRVVKVWDVGEQEEAFEIADHPENIFSMEWSPDGKHMGTTCRDRLLRIFDPRTESVAQQCTTHDGVKTSKCFWMQDKNMIGSVGFKKSSVREILFFDQRKLGSPVHTKDLDQANSVLNPMYEPANSILFLAGKGDTNIKFFECTEQDGFCHFLSAHVCAQPQKGVSFMPRRGVDVGKPELTNVYRLNRDQVVPCSILAPRKNAQAVFQEDLYPDCPGTTPSMTAAEYLDDNLSRPPILISLRPEGQSAGGKRRRRGKNKGNDPAGGNGKAAEEKPKKKSGGGESSAADRIRIEELEGDLKKANAKNKELTKKLAEAQKELESGAGAGASEELEKQLAMAQKKLKRAKKDADEAKELRKQVASLREEVEQSEEVIAEQGKKIRKLQG